LLEEFGRDGGNEVVFCRAQPRANQRIGIPSEAFRGGASARGPRRGGELLAFRMRLRRKASGESENLLRPCGSLSALIFARFKQYFWFLLRVPLLAVSDT